MVKLVSCVFKQVYHMKLHFGQCWLEHSGSVLLGLPTRENVVRSIRLLSVTESPDSRQKAGYEDL